MSERIRSIGIPSIIFLASFVLHLFFLSSPGRAVFDEAHFATYAAQYARHEAHFDIHPPLGKLLYGSVLTFFPSQTYTDADFITIDSRAGLTYGTVDRTFGTFPYVPLRILASLFGALLPLLGYLFLKRLTDNPYAPVLAGIFLLFENALLMETRLILLNGMALTFGFLSLIFYFQKKQLLILSGICLGLAISIKLTAIVFGVLLFLAFVAGIPKSDFRTTERALGTIVFIALIVLGLSSSTHLFIVPMEDQLSVLIDFGAQLTPGLPSGWEMKPPVIKNVALFLKIYIDSFDAMVGGYLGGLNTHIAMSRWFTWPFTNGGFTYANLTPSSSILLPIRTLFSDSVKLMGFMGNLAVWLSGTIAFVFSAYFLVRKKMRNFNESPALFVLILGWIASLLPFAVFVKRASFVYHYFPALIFSVLLASYWLGIILEKISPKKRSWLAGGIIGIVLLFFMLALPYTYGVIK